jgi:hypothetical protein
MGRAPGLSAEERAAIGERTRRNWAARRPWLEASKGILAAANAGVYAEASELLFDYIAEREAEMAPDTGQFLNYSAADRRDVIAEISAYADELHSETPRLQERKRQRVIADDEMEEFRVTVLNDIRRLLALSVALRRMREPGPYVGIPSPATRAAARRACQADLDSR